MDQIIIGKFIASERKRKGYTQRQLADLLQISDKTISKWERGNGFPEVSLLLPLCRELDITVNELLSGERVSEEDYQKDYQQKAEENMVKMIQEREQNKKKAILTIISGTTSTAAFITLILVVGVYTEAIALPVKILLVCIACAIFISGLIVAMEGSAQWDIINVKHAENILFLLLARMFLACTCCQQDICNVQSVGKRHGVKRFYRKMGLNVSAPFFVFKCGICFSYSPTYTSPVKSRILQDPLR